MASVNMKAISATIAKDFLQGRGYKKPLNFRFGKPQFNVEWGEIGKAVKGKSTPIDEAKAMGYARWIGLAKTGGMVKVTKATAKVIENSHVATPNKFNELTEDRKERVLAQINSGEVELSIVASYGSDYKWLIAGNTRLTAMMKLFGEGYVWEYQVPEEQRIGLMFPRMKMNDKHRGNMKWIRGVS